MLSKIIVALSFLLVGVLIHTPNHTEAACNVCDNGIACINETAFHMCFGGRPNNNQVFSCPEKSVCRNSASIKCVDDANEPSCKPSEGCGICNEFKAFACTSRTTFVQCNGDEVSNITGVCPKGLICDSTYGDICKDERNIPNGPECDREKPL